MKLIELLARELKEWPEGVPTIDQSVVDGELYGRNAGGMLIWREYIEGLVTATDVCTAKIFRTQWEAAVGGRLAQPEPTVTVHTPTLETMLTEWRDLEARAQAAQAEADALFEHAGQCHGEIVVRLAELGWGKRMVPGEPVVTLDDNDGWIEWTGGTCPVPNDAYVEVKLRASSSSFDTGRGGEWGWRVNPEKPSGGDIVAYRLTPSTQP